MAATPLNRTERGLKAVIELTCYPDGHAQIAVSRIAGSPRDRRITQADVLPLNHLDEAKEHLIAIAEHACAAASREATGPAR